MTRLPSGDPVADALDTLLDLDVLTEIAARARRAIHVTEIAPLLEQQAIRHDRTAEWHADRGRYDLAAGARGCAQVPRPGRGDPHARRSPRAAQARCRATAARLIRFARSLPEGGLSSISPGRAGEQAFSENAPTSTVDTLAAFSARLGCEFAVRSAVGAWTGSGALARFTG